MCGLCIVILLVNLSLHPTARWPDSLNVRFIGNWPFGASRAVVAADEYVLLGSGGGIYVVDISDPMRPVVVSDTMRTRGFVTSMRASYLSPPAAVLYAGVGKAGIEAWDILNLPIPERICTYTTPGYAHDYDAMGTFRQWETYVAAGDSGLRVVNLYLQPEEIGFCYTPGSAEGLRYDGSLVYVADGNAGLRVINVNDPTNPFETGFYDTPGHTNAVDVYWDYPVYYAYLADGYTGICIVDIMNPSNPQYIGQYYTPGWICNVKVVNSHLYISKDYDGFEVTTLIPPLQYVDEYDTPGYACDADYTYYQNCALIADWHEGLRLIDVTVPFQEIGHLDVPDNTYSICMSDSCAYIANRHGGVRVLDITHPDYPREAGYCLTPGDALSIDLSGICAYVADDNTGLTVVDIATPANPHIIGSCDTPGNARDIYVHDSCAYIADAHEGLRIINVATPSNPSEIGFLDTPGSATGVYVIDSLAYVADSSGSGLRIISIADPANPQEIGSCVTPGNAHDVYVVEPYAYIADGSAGLRIIDVVEPSNPQEIGFLDTPGYAYGVYVLDSFCYVSDSTFVRIVNISTPTNPQEIGYYSTPDCAYSIDVDNAYIYVADGVCGVQVYQNTLASNAQEATSFSVDRLFHLCQNPVRGENIAVQFHKGHMELTRLDIYNILGQKVKSVDLNYLQAGYHDKKIKVGHMTSGVYFLRFTAGTYTATSKLLLIR
jgi:hypothetical protein